MITVQSTPVEELIGDVVQPDCFPLSFSQERLWFLECLEPDSCVYNCRASVRMTGPLQLSALEQSLEELVRNHEILRSSILDQKGMGFQRVHRSIRLRESLLDLSAVSPAEQMRHVQQISTCQTLRRFELTSAPLLRVALFRLAPDDHVLLFVVHHLITDDWSMNILIRQLGVIYQHYANASPSPVPDPQLQFRQFAMRERASFGSPDLLRQRAYWRRQLAGVQPLELATDRPRPKRQTFAGDRRWLNIPPELTEKIRATADRENATPFMIFASALFLLLNRYSQTPDITLGIAIANRNQTDTEDLIGFLVNTLVLRCQINDELPLRDLLLQVRNVALDAYNNQEVPFAKVVEDLQPQRTPAFNPLFQVMLIYQNGPGHNLLMSDVHVSPLQTSSPRARTDLTMMVTEQSDSLSVTIEYNVGLYGLSTIKRLLGHFQNILTAIVSSPNTKLCNVPFQDRHEQSQMVLHFCRGNSFPRPSAGTIHELFYQQVQQTPDSIALVCEDHSITYSGLSAKAHQIARCLRHKNVGPETRVGVYLPRSISMVAAALGTLTAGAAYLPLDPSYPAERLAFMIKDAKPKVMIAASPHLQVLRAQGYDVIDVNNIAPCLAANHFPQVATDQSAYVLYTSGSTGQPKGVIGLHAGAVNRFHWMWRQMPFAAGEISSFKTAPNFVDSIWEMFGALLQGIPTVIFNDLVTRDISVFIHELNRFKVARLVVVPSMLRGILDVLESQQLQLPFLRLCTSSGEMLSADLCKRFKERCPHCRLLNLYGSSEVAGDVTWSNANCDQDLRVPIGRPIDDTSVYALDRHSHLVPIGVIGEAYAGGRNLARGYLGRPDLTAERFLPNPFGEPGSRLYRTGDLIRLDSNGQIHLHGRTDRQIKMRGHRIELDEIQNRLRQHPLVADAVICSRQDPSLSRESQIIAYVIPIDSPAHVAGEDLQHELRTYLKQHLTEPMIPRFIVFTESFPLSPTGKLDLRRLPSPTVDQPDLSRAHTPPRTETEDQLARIWGDLLKCKVVDVNANFFELGGHSLLVTQLLSRVRDRFAIELPAREAFEARSLAAMAEGIEAQLEKILNLLNLVQA
jgi:amino acid adenylation domain-containing protein